MSNDNNEPQQSTQHINKKNKKQSRSRKVVWICITVIVCLVLHNAAERIIAKPAFSELEVLSDCKEITFEDFINVKSKLNIVNDASVYNNEYCKGADFFLSFSHNVTCWFFESSEKAKADIPRENYKEKIVYSYIKDDFMIIVFNKDFMFGLDDLNYSDMKYKQSIYIKNGKNVFCFTKYGFFSQSSFENEVENFYKELVELC